MPTPETDAAKFYVGTSREQYVPAKFCERLERERNDLRAELKVKTMALASTQSQLAKCRIQRERFHSQLRSKRGDGSTCPGDHA
ncbi:MAG: hypothetical protein V4819_19195 [Verrucomicrobiota bacterium]